MLRAKKPQLTFAEKMARIHAAQISESNRSSSTSEHDKEEDEDFRLESLDVRIRKILGVTEKANKSKGRMLFFVMYDISSNKVRRLVHKYLRDNGCTNVQHSVYLAEAPIETYNKIKRDLEEVQAAYENDDSILVLPISTDHLRMMKIIGQHIAVDVITHNKNTLFF